MFYKIGTCKNLVKFTGKHLRWSLFLNKIAGWGPVTLLKRRLWHRCFLVNFAKFSGTFFLQNNLRKTALMNKDYLEMSLLNHLA